MDILQLAAQDQPIPKIEQENKGELIREFYDAWVEQGGYERGRRIRSVRQIKEWLGLDKEVRSLEPKLAGRTNLTREDAASLFFLFLSRWFRGKRLGDEEPYYDGKTEILTEKIVDLFYNNNNNNYTNKERGLLLPDRRENKSRTNDIPKSLEVSSQSYVDFFQNSDALFTVSIIRTIDDGPGQIRLFYKIMEMLRNIDKKDNRKRILIWIVDIGRRKEDNNALMALRNLDTLAFQFRAIALTDHENKDALWKWLIDRAIILVGGVQDVDIERCYRRVNIVTDNTPTDLPWFNSGLLFLNEMPDRWVTAQELRLLYGQQLERLSERAFNINASLSGWSDEQNSRLRYFGLGPPVDTRVQPSTDKPRSAVELPIPSRRHNDAFWLAYAAANYRLGENNSSLNDFKPDQSLDLLRRHNFVVLRLAEFLNITGLLTDT